MPYAVYKVDESPEFSAEIDGLKRHAVAVLTDDEMLAIGRLRGLRFQLLMADDVEHALDKLSPAFDDLAVSRLDRRLEELKLEMQGSNEPSKGDNT